MILYRYIIKEYIFPFFASLSVIVFYFIMQQAALLLNKIVSKGLDPRVVLEIFLIQLGWIIALAIPMAILTASLWVFGRMSGDNEITSIKASGQSLFPLLLPVFAAAAVFTVFMVFFNDLILPDANHRTANLLSDISRKRPAAFIEPRVLISDFTGYSIYADDVNARTGGMKGIRIFCDLPGQDPSTTVASRGTIKMTPDQQFLELTLYDGETHSLSRKNGTDYFLGRFGRQVVFIRNIDTKLERTKSSYRSDREMSSQAMLDEVKRLEAGSSGSLAEYRGRIDSLCRAVKRLDSGEASVKAEAASAGTADGRQRAVPADFAQWAERISAAAPSALARARETQETADRVSRYVRSNEMTISQYLVEVHKKYSIPVACLIFVLIGAPLGIMARRGGLLVGGLTSIFFFIAYWAFLIGGEALGDKTTVPPAVAMWSGNFVIGLCGVVLMLLMLRETTLRFDWLIALWKKNAAAAGRMAKNPVFRLAALCVRLPKWLLKRTVGTLPMYLISIFSAWTVGISFALIAIFVVIDYVSNIRQFEQATSMEIVLYYLYSMPWVALTFFPLVLLLASMAAIGILAKHSELIAMKSAGISIRQLTVPLLLLGILLSIGTFYAGEKVIPAGNIRKKELVDSFKEPPGSPLRRHGAAKDKSGLREFRRNFFYFGDRNTMYVFREFGTRPQMARGIWRETFDTSRITERIQAENMVYDSTGWRFVRGTIRTFGPEGAVPAPFDTLRDSLLRAEPIDMVARIKSPEEMSYWELQGYIDAARRRGEDVRKFLGELEFKIALPFMNFIVILLGVAITARAGRKGVAMLVGLGLGLAFAFYLISRFAIVFAQNGHLPVLVGAWIGNAVFLALGVILYRRASR
jgi:lipopolysaccharide export system permease protein